MIMSTVEPPFEQHFVYTNLAWVQLIWANFTNHKIAQLVKLVNFILTL